MTEAENIPQITTEIKATDILTRAFDIYSKNFLPYFLTFLVIGALSTLLSYSIDPEAYTQVSTVFTVAEIFSLIIGFVLSNVANGLVIKLTSEIYTKGKGDVKSSFNHSMARIIPLLVGSLFFAVLVGVGLVLLIVPGVLLFIMFCLINQFIMLEDKGVLEAFSSSRNLVSKNWTKVFYLALLLILIIFTTAFFSDIFAEYLGTLGSQIIGQVVSALIEPLWPISFTILYYQLRNKKNLEKQLIQQM